MAQAPTSRPPFRADHVGSLLRPKGPARGLPSPCRRRAVGLRLPGHPRCGNPRGGAAAGRGRPGSRHRRGVPPQLLLGSVRRALSGLCNQAGGLQVPRRPRPRGGFHRDLRRRQARAPATAGCRRVRVPEERCRGDAEDHHAGALDHAFLPLHRLRRSRRLRRRAPFLRRPHRHLSRRDRRSWRGGLPLYPAR